MAEARRQTVVAIHQPNFFPWLGYFDKIARADVFVVLDDVQFAKSGAGTWSNRVRLLIGGQPTWITMPIRRDYHGVRAVSEMAIDNRQPWRDKLSKTIKMNYARAAFFSEAFPLIERLCSNPTESLADFNTSAIRAICDAVGLDSSRLVLSSSLGITETATDRLIALVKAVGGTTYLAGGGAGGYQEDEKFEAAGLQLAFQSFQHPQYPQRGDCDFVPGLSCLDALLECGFEGTAALLAKRGGGVVADRPTQAST
jgi:hypothetical protein